MESNFELAGTELNASINKIKYVARGEASQSDLQTAKLFIGFICWSYNYTAWQYLGVAAPGSNTYVMDLNGSHSVMVVNWNNVNGTISATGGPEPQQVTVGNLQGIFVY